MAAPTIDVNYTDSDFIQKPFPQLTTMREAGSFVRNASIGVNMITRHGDIVSSFRDTQRFSSRPTSSLSGAPT